jgi:DNA polymerase III subunit delta
MAKKAKKASKATKAGPARSAVYVIHGKDPYLVADARRKILADVLGEADPQLCVTTFEDSAELRDVLDELRTLPFLAPHRVAVIRNAEAFVSAHRDKLEDYFDNPAETGTLVLEVGTWNKSTKLAKKLPSVGELIACESPAGRDLVDWIITRVAEQGMKIEQAAANLLAQAVDDDLGQAASEVEKLCLYAAGNNAITARDVTDIVTARISPEAFALVNAIIAAPPSAALEELDRAMTTRGAEFAILGQLGWHVRRALQVAQAINDGQSPTAACKANKVWYDQDRFLAMLRRRGMRALQQDMRRLLQADLSMKSGRDARSAMQELVVQLSA